MEAQAARVASAFAAMKVASSRDHLDCRVLCRFAHDVLLVADLLQCGLCMRHVHASSLSWGVCPQEFPSIRFRAKAPGDDNADGRILAASRLATNVFERLDYLQRRPGNLLPATDTCEFLVLDRCASNCVLILQRSLASASGAVRCATIACQHCLLPLFCDCCTLPVLQRQTAASETSPALHLQIACVICIAGCLLAAAGHWLVMQAALPCKSDDSFERVCRKNHISPVTCWWLGGSAVRGTKKLAVQELCPSCASHTSVDVRGPGLQPAGPAE